MAFMKPSQALIRSSLAVIGLFACCALAQTTATDLQTPGAMAQPETAQPSVEAGEATAEPAAATAAPAAAPEPPPETCRTITDKAMAADLKALTAQSQKLDVASLVPLHSASTGFWTKAVELCDGRAKERAQRNLTESQKALALLNEQLGDGPECGAAHKDAVTLQDMARAALAERRWEDAATLFHKSEDMWDLATERCSGAQKELASKRLEQAETDGFNAEFCAPLFDRAREHTQKLRASSAGMSREEKQDGLMVAETLWRDALAQCKGSAAQDSARNNAQALARERGTPWVARNPPAAASQAPKVATPVTKPVVPAPPVKAAAPATPLTPPSTASVSALTAPVPVPAITTEATSTKAPKVSLAPLPVASVTTTTTPIGTAAAPSLPVAPLPTPVVAESPKPQIQPEEFTVGDIHFKGQFVRDVDTPTLSGSGKLTWANGDKFEGTLQNGKRNGKGLFIWANGQRYQGDWVNDMSTGQATVDFTNGDHYEGSVVNASPKGLGSMRYASGDNYRGGFEAGEPNGTGVYVWKNGQTFEGDWKNGKPNGQGTMHFANGDGYTGQWKAGLKDGQGTFTWTTGDRWEGIYENDQQTSNGNLIRKSP